MRPSNLLLCLCLGLFLFAGLTAVADSARTPIQLAQTPSAPSDGQTQLEKEGVSGTLILVVLVVIIVLIAMAMFGGDDFEPAPVGTTRHEVPDDDQPFLKGDFWFEGVYYFTCEAYEVQKGHVYTNSMYNANYETWGMGQGRDEDKDASLLETCRTNELGETVDLEGLDVAELDLEVKDETADNAS
jgi:hypothetical protein